MRRARFFLPLLAPAVVAGMARAAEVSSAQRPSESEGERFLFRGAVDGVRIVHERVFYNCCLQFAPEVQIDEGAIRVTERNEGPPCRCADVPWDLTVEIRALLAQDYDVFLFGSDGSVLATARLTVPRTPTMPFVRGRVNDDERLDVSDAVSILAYLFGSGAAPPCLDAADANDDETVDISDGIYLLSYLFTGGSEPPPPFPGAGEDPTTGGILCSLENSVVASDFVPTADVNGDGVFDISDCAAFLTFLRFGVGEIPCPDALDLDDDGALTLSDLLPFCSPIGPLAEAPAPPLGGDCGPDPTPDRLGCGGSNCPR